MFVIDKTKVLSISLSLTLKPVNLLADRRDLDRLRNSQAIFVSGGRVTHIAIFLAISAFFRCQGIRRRDSKQSGGNNTSSAIFKCYHVIQT